MNRSAWLQFPVQNGKRKRAELACEVCHSRKVKCDLQTRRGDGLQNCSNCAASGKECRPRQSRRDRSRHNIGNTESQTVTPPGDSINEVESDLSGRRANGVNVTPNREPQTSTGATPAENNMSTFIHNNSVPNRPQQTVPNNTIQSPVNQLSHHDSIRSHSVVSPVASIIVRGEYPDSYSADTGFLQVYGPENQSDAINQELANQARKKPDQINDVPSLDLLQGFCEVYFEHCYTWCPVLDKVTLDDEIARSSMLSNAIALAGSHIQPPMIPHEGPAVYYGRAKRLFYEEEENDLMLSLKALLLFYWWSPKPPSAVHKNSSWWWQSVIIRHCQQIGIHREPGPDNPLRSQLDLPLRRRIWWTAFARERLTALCQSRPAIIDPDDCNIQEPTLDDFPEPRDDLKAEVFIYWVRLCSIIGRIAKFLSQHYAPSPIVFPEHLARELITWARSIPARLRLPIDTAYTTGFNLDVHQLYLPYLAVIIVLHLKRSPQTLPQACQPAMLAASCIARILKDILARGAARSLMAITCWYTGTAFIGLLAASKTPKLTQSANADLDILTLAIKQLKNMWPTAAIFDQGFARLRASTVGEDGHNSMGHDGAQAQNLQGPGDSAAERVSLVSSDDGIDWMEYFPFVSPATSKIAERLLAERNKDISFENEEAFPESMMLYFQDLFEPYEGLSDMTLFT